MLCWVFGAFLSQKLKHFLFDLLRIRALSENVILMEDMTHKVTVVETHNQVFGDLFW